MKDLEERVQFLETVIKVLQTSVIETEVRCRNHILILIGLMSALVFIKLPQVFRFIGSFL